MACAAKLRAANGEGVAQPNGNPINHSAVGRRNGPLVGKAASTLAKYQLFGNSAKDGIEKQALR